MRVIDPESGRLRASTKGDVADSARFVDAVPQVSFYWGPVVTAEDVPLATRPLHELEAIFANTSKHFQAVDVVGADMTRRAVEMARVVAGGSDELRRRPIMSLIACPIDPLGNEAVSLEAALVAAEAGVPVGFLSLTLACASAPATMAGNLVVNLAGVIAGLVLAAARLSRAHPCSWPARRASWTSRPVATRAAAPRTTSWLPPPPRWPTTMGFAMNMGTMASGAKEPGWQAAVDDALSTLASASARRGDDERLRSARRLEDPELRAPAHGGGGVPASSGPMTGGIEVNDETLALDVISQGRPERDVPRREAHAAAPWRDLAADRLGPVALRAMDAGGPARRARERRGTGA